MDEGNDLTGWILGGIGTVGVAMASAITALWKTAEAKNAKAIEALQARADDCEKDREDLKVRVARMEEQLDQHEGAG